MEGLKSSALVPGELEHKTECNLLNMLLVKIPKEVDLRPILNIKPLQPRHCVALRELHSQIFPIDYDPKFFEVACSTECGFFDTQSFWDLFDLSSNDTRDLNWYQNQIMAIGLFLPRSYVSFFRKTGEYAVDKYLEYVKKDDCYNEFDDPLSEMVVFDSECDEFLIGFVTLLVNLEATCNLISDEDFPIIQTYYKTINSNYKFSDINNEINSKYTFFDKGGEDLFGRKLNVKALNAVNYSFLYNQLYNNGLLMEYIKKFKIKNAKTIYILSTGITLGLRRRSLGSLLILFVQILFYYIYYNVLVFDNNYYEFLPKSSTQFKPSHLLSMIQDYYNKLCFKNNFSQLYLFYNFLLNKYVDHTLNGIEHTIKLDTDDLYHKITNEMKDLSNLNDSLNEFIANHMETINDLNDQNDEYNSVIEDESDVKEVDNLPLVIYLHTIYYNEVATEMYKKLNFINVTNIPNYYNINNKKYNANFLAYYL